MHLIHNNVSRFFIQRRGLGEERIMMAYIGSGTMNSVRYYFVVIVVD